MAIPDPYSRGLYHGKPLDHATIAALKLGEQLVGREFTCYQGIGGAPTSAGTHTEGRAVDLAPISRLERRVLKDLGFAIWHRDTTDDWVEHEHGILIFENRQNSRGLNDIGFRQIAAFDDRKDGLVSNLNDFSYRPTPPAVFTMADYERTFAAPSPRWDSIWETANKISKDHPGGEDPKGVDARRVRRIAAKWSSEH